MEEEARTCPECTAPADQDARFCARCGAPLAAAREARKVVTALFVDIVGSTTLGERFDPEDFREIVREAVARAVGVCERYGGVIENVAGDGALALFGAPVTHEDDPERAVLAGLEIPEEIARWSSEVRERWDVEALAVRVGIETGTVVVGVQGASIESGSMGDTLNTAARIQSEAEPGTVLVGPRTRRHVAELFEWGPDRELTLRGKREPVVLCRALGRKADGGASRPRQSTTRVVGRDAELEQAREAVREAAAGSGSLFLVLGEAGVGKSRLLGEMQEMFRAASAQTEREGLWLEGRCASYGESLPYWPIQSLLREWLGASDADPLEASTLQERLSPILSGVESTVMPHLASLLGLGAGSGTAGAAQDASPALQRQRIHDAVAFLLERLAGRGPVALVLEDVHWSDASSADLLEQLIGLASSGPLLLVMSARPEGGDTLAQLLRAVQAEPAGSVTEVRLGALPAEAERALLGELIGAGSLPEELERAILERAEGNPLYLEELALSLIDTGAVVREEGGWRFDRSVPIEIPDTLEKIVLARVDRLPDHCHSVLGAAAVIGRRFDQGVLEQVAGQSCGPVLEELEELELIRAEGPDGAYLFKHFVIREAAYNALLKSERRRLHGRAAEVLEAIGAGQEESSLGLIAGHYRTAGELERALDFRTRAAESAARIPAFPEALAHCDDALAITSELELEPVDPRVRRLRLTRGQARFSAGLIDEAREDIDIALSAARQAGNLQEQVTGLLGLVGVARFGGDWDRAERRAVQALELTEAMGDTSTQASILQQLSILESNRLRLDRALEFGHRARRLAESSGRRDDMVPALDALKLAALFSGDLELLDRSAGQLVELHRESGDLSGYLPWVLIEWSHVPLLRGSFEEAVERIEQALAISREAGSRVADPLILATRCWLERSRGNHAEAVSHGREAVEGAAGMGTDEWEAWARASLGWAFLDAGRAGPALAELEAGLRAAEKAGALAQRIRCAALLAEATQHLGDEGRAAELAATAEDLLSGVSAPADGTWLWGGHAILALGRVRLGGGDPDAAHALVSPLAEIAARSGWQELAADCRVALGRSALARGREAEARELLEQAAGDAEAYPPVAERAHRALAELTGARS